MDSAVFADFTQFIILVLGSLFVDLTAWITAIFIALVLVGGLYRIVR